MSVTQVAFFTRISDKSIGGTYMTLLNTISNLGSHWPATLALFLVDYISVKQCIKQNASPLNSTLLTINAINNNRCTSELETLVNIFSKYFFAFLLLLFSKKN
jgi:PAT family acetyl-CoA transporter-like MFS transporter 1